MTVLETASSSNARFGWISFAIGAFALIGSVAIFWAGPFAPQQTAGVSLGELAADVAKSTLRSAMGMEQPAPQVVQRTIDDLLEVAVVVTGVIAAIFAGFALARHENKRPAIVGAVLGVSAVLFQFFIMAFFALLGVLIIMALLHSFEDFFSGIFGG